jgi:hypothetical protein
MKFREARNWFAAQEYDFVRNTGEQRPENAQWSATLRRRMEADEFAPACWSAGLRKSHRDRLEFPGDGTVVLHVNRRNPLPHIDGNHRCKAMMAMLNRAEAVLAREKASEAERQQARDTIDHVDNCDVLVQVFLEPERTRATFQALQEGKKVSADLTGLQKQRDEKDPVRRMAGDVALALNKSTASHLYGHVATTSSAVNMIGFKTLKADSASELACSTFGGAKIAVANGWGMDTLQATYEEAWHIVREFTAAEEYGGEQVPSVLLPGKLLCPLGPFSGKKGGTSLIVGVGNMLAWYKGHKGRDKATTDDMKTFAASIDAILDQPAAGGLDAPKKRSIMALFAGDVFERAGVMLEPGERPKAGKVGARDGVVTYLGEEREVRLPAPLVDLLAPSAFALKPLRKADEEVGLDDETLEVPDEEGATEDEVVEDGSGPEANVTVSRKNRRRLSVVNS